MVLLLCYGMLSTAASLGRFFAIVIVIIVIVGVLTVQFTAARAVDHNAEDVVFAERLHRARNGVESGGTDAHDQNRAVGHRRQQVRIGREKQAAGCRALPNRSESAMRRSAARHSFRLSSSSGFGTGIAGGQQPEIGAFDTPQHLR